MSLSSVLVFDMDGVLAEVSESYLAAIEATVKHFTRQTPSREVIEKYKQAGGWNNDWALSQRLVYDMTKRDVSYPDVVTVFQSFFIGTDSAGLITKEKWIPINGLLPRLSQKHGLAIFTGRPRAELNITLRRFAPEVRWEAVIADEDVSSAKPAPDGLKAIAAARPGTKLTYVGDNVDDARSARAAGVAFIGIAEPRQTRLTELLREEGAFAVIASVNEIEGVL